MRFNFKLAALFVGIACIPLLLWQMQKPGRTRPDIALSFTQFINDVEAGKVQKVWIDGVHVKGEYRDHAAGLHTLIPRDYLQIYNILRESGVEIEVLDDSRPGWVSVLVNASPFLLLLAFWVYLMRRTQGGKKNGSPRSY